jgi:hypothetical protein
MADITYEEPKWCLSQPAEDACSTIASTGPTPFILTGVIVRLLQYHFSDPNNITKPHLKGYVWTPEEGCGDSKGDVWVCPTEGSSSSEEEDGCPPEVVEETEASRILIAPDYARTTGSVQSRPALYVKREPVKNSKISFLNRALPGLDKETGLFHGEKHQVTIEGSHSIICVGQSGTEAENLAEEVYFRMLHYQSLIKNDFRLSGFFVEGTSEVQEIAAESKKAFYVVVRCSWAHVHRWILIPETPIIKRLNISYDDCIL